MVRPSHSAVLAWAYAVVEIRIETGILASLPDTINRFEIPAFATTKLLLLVNAE